MDVFEAIKKRRSVREYLDKPVEEQKLKEILEAARLAPSASNKQEWRFVVVTNKGLREQLVKAAKGQAFVGQVPVVIACCAETDNHVMTCGQLCYPIDVAIAIDHITLRAVELGLGTCWIGAFWEDEVRKILDIPKDIKVVELLCLGYAKEKSQHPKDRLEIGKIVFSEKWNKPYQEK
ncbi:MAG: nitroreductase family protein [Candidatus Omnitrophica bacterium]|jgi:nitroreductase|nr:nitroreductase family protein [Candidatus Omnitrophota bacterium]